MSSILFTEFQRPREQVKVPATSDNIPDEIPYLLVGGGTASFSAFRAIKSHDPTAKVRLFPSLLKQSFNLDSFLGASDVWALFQSMDIS